jgi:shikimate kinase
MRALWLVGMMGSGKTAVGALVADRLGLPLVDIDSRIETETDRSITSIWMMAGEAAFRDLETEQISRIVTAGVDCVVATGGGAVLREENVSAMRRQGLVVWLTADPAELVMRLGDGVTRPLIADGQTDRRVADLLANRHRLYAEAAHYTVDTGSKSPDEVAREVTLLWNVS